MGASSSMVGIIIGSYGFTQLLLRIPIGVVSDALGRRKVFVIGGICLAVFSALGMWFFVSVLALLIFRALSGVAAAAWVDYTVLYVSYFPAKDMSKAIGYINAASLFGQVSGMLTGGYVAQEVDLTSCFLLGAVGGGIGLILSMLIEEDISPRKKLSTKALNEVLHDVNLLRVSGLGIVLQVVMFVTIFGFSPVVAKALGADNFELGLLSTLCIVPSIISSALSGTVFTKHFGERAVLFGGFFCIALSCIVIPFINELFWLYLSQAVYGFCMGLVLPLLMGLSIKNFPDEKRSTAMGIFQAIYGIGMFGGPVLAGIVSNQFGLSWAFWVTGFICLLGSFLVVWKGYLPLTARKI